MKNILYIGNNLKNSKSNLSGIQILGPLLEKEGFSVYYASSQSNKVLRLLDMIRACIVYSKKVDVVLIDTYSTQNFYFAWMVAGMCNVLKLPYIPILHGGDLPKRLKNSVKKSKYIFNNSLYNVAPSLYLKKAFEEKGFHNIIHIPNTLEIENYSLNKSVFEIPKLLWVRSFSKIYNPQLAIKVLKLLKEQYPEAQLCMVGPDVDGTLKAITDLALKLNVDVKITGKLSKKDWIDLAKHYNIFINTTNFDNMPVSVIEAMALGLPVVSTNVGGLPYLIANTINGILVEPNSEKAMTLAITALMTDNLMRENIIKNARLQAEEYNWEIVKKKWINILE
nr:glycosyltransferase family 4 protein [uncultured Psychroserpens sp.]